MRVWERIILCIIHSDPRWKSGKTGVGRKLEEFKIIRRERELEIVLCFQNLLLFAMWLSELSISDAKVKVYQRTYILMLLNTWNVKFNRDWGNETYQGRILFACFLCFLEKWVEKFTSTEENDEPELRGEGNEGKSVYLLESSEWIY